MSFDHGGTVYATARALGCPPSELLDFSASINPLGLSSSIRAACLAALDQAPHYPDPSCRRLVEALSAYHAIDSSSIAVANGSTRLIHLLPELFPHRSALIVAPAFSEYRHSLQRQNRPYHEHLLSPADGFTLDPDRLAQDLHRHRPGLLYFCNPGNPSGRLYTPAEITALLALCRQYEVLPVLDEAFIDFCGEQFSHKQAVISGGQGVVLRSLTKFYALAGLRLGCAFAAPELAQRIRDALPPWEVNTVAQFAGTAALADHAHADATRELITAERRLLSDTLQRLPGLRLFPSSANYLLLELTGAMHAPQLCERLLRTHRIMARDCSNFSGLGDRFLRVAVRSRAENERLIEALRTELSGRERTD